MTDVHFSDWLAARTGSRHWCIASRTTRQLRDKGYDTVLTPKRYRALQVEWEVERYGAPLASLMAAAPDLLAALDRLLMWLDTGGGPSRVAIDNARTAIAKATGDA